MRTPRFLRYFLLFLALLAVPACSFAGVFVSVNIAPPELPVYEQPICPGDGYIWTPGYWAWDADGGYYWVPGSWVFAPYTGALWTPGYWGWNNGFYVWNGGYWGLHIGFYGGVDYGYGYYGHGYEGGYWDRGHFSYNRTINHIDNHVHNVYERNVSHGPDNRVAFNGGERGIHAEPSQQERNAQHEQHINAVPLQQQHQKAAQGNRAQFANVNHGNPAVVATQRPGAQAFHQALAHPNNPQAVQAARTAPAMHNGGQNNGQSSARPAPANLTHAPEQAHPQQQQQPHPQQQNHLQPQQQLHPQQAQPQQQNHPQQFHQQEQARPAAPVQQAHPQQMERQQPAIQSHPQPAAQPHPQEQARPAAPVSRPAPQPQSRPAPQPHPQMAAPHPAPQGGGGAPHGGGPGGGGEDHNHH